MQEQRVERYRAELEAARTEAKAALLELTKCLKGRTRLRVLARTARRAQLAAAAVYTAASCLIDPP